MSVNTKVRLKGHVIPEEIINFINQKMDAKLTNMKIDSIDCNTFSVTSGYIYFDKIPFGIFYYWVDENLMENHDYWVEKGLKDMVETHSTELITNCNDQMKKVLYDIVKEFGGWIDYDDSDNIYYESVIKQPDDTIQPVIYTTMDEINEKFGGIVVIKK